ncbi:MAG: universal stress protein [Chloroflexota bacterium]
MNQHTTLNVSSVSALLPEAPTKRVLVALDASPQSLAALEGAASLARLLDAEILGVFVKDTDLERLCSLPFSKEIGAYSSTARALSQFCISREFHALEEAIRAALQQAAGRSRVPWSLHVTQGNVTGELLQAAQEATVLSLGRSGWSQRRQFGSTAKTILSKTTQPILLPALGSNRFSRQDNIKEIKVIYTGTAAAERALNLARQLADESGRTLVIYTMSSQPPTVPHSGRTIVEVSERISSSQMITFLERREAGVTVLPDVESRLTASLIDVVLDPVLLVA